MKKSTRTGTPVYARKRSDELTLPQLSAVDLLIAGKTDTEVAALLGLCRTTVTKWRLYNVEFQAYLEEKRKEVWSAGIDKLRALLPKVMDVLALELEGPHRLKAAVEVLKLLPPQTALSEFGPTDPDEIVRRVVSKRRNAERGPMETILDEGKDLPPFEEHCQQVRDEFDHLASDDPPTG